MENIHTLEEQLVIFRLKDEEFGMDINSVKEIIRIPEITAIPNSQFYMEGVINLRGKVLPVLNLKKIFGYGYDLYETKEKIVIIEVKNTTLGILVDDVTEVLKVAKTNIEPAPTNVLGKINNYIRGIGKINERLIILLDIINLLPSEDIKDIEASINK